MRAANITPVFNEKDPTDKANYRPISLLQNLSKLLERCLYNQLYPFFDKISSMQQYVFMKGFRAQHCIIRRLEAK